MTSVGGWEGQRDSVVGSGRFPCEDALTQFVSDLFISIVCKNKIWNKNKYIPALKWDST